MRRYVDARVEEFKSVEHFTEKTEKSFEDTENFPWVRNGLWMMGPFLEGR
jgi:hypothetical protein